MEAAQGPGVTLEKYFPCSMFPTGKWSKHPSPVQFPRALWRDDDDDDDAMSLKVTKILSMSTRAGH